MTSRIRGRISSAHVIAVIALILAMTGTSVALQGKNTVDTGDIKNQTITSADVRKNTLNGNQINEAKLGKVPLATSALDSADVLWAAVKNPNGAGNAALLRAGQLGTVAGEGTNLVNVAFARDVSTCSWTATSQGAGYAQTSATPGAVTSVTVRTRNDQGTLDDEPFNLQVVC